MSILPYPYPQKTKLIINHLIFNIMDFSQKFDLTTKEGWLNAGLLLSGPTGWIPFLIKEMFTDNTEKQVEAAKELIETAKQNGYKRIACVRSLDMRCILSSPLLCVWPGECRMPQKATLSILI